METTDVRGASPQSALACLLFNGGLAHTASGEYREALPYLTQALALDPTNLNFVLVAIKAQVRAGQLADALRYIELAERLDPQTPGLRRIRAEAERRVSQARSGEAARQRSLRGSAVFLWVGDRLEALACFLSSWLESTGKRVNLEIQQSFSEGP
jgi:tetratricopeptide (TPR) repeat protein